MIRRLEPRLLWLAAALAAGGPPLRPTVAAEAPSPGAPAGAARVAVPVGAVTGRPEQDTVGYAGAAFCTPAVLYSAQPRAVGTVTGAPERDTYAFVVEGVRPCDTTGSLD